MHNFAVWLAGTAISQEIQVVNWVIPVSQTIHILAVAAALGSIAMIGFRILGIADRSQTMAQTAHRFVPWVWTALVVLTLTGTVQIIGEPKRALDNNPAFQLKMLMLVLAIIALLAFQFSLRTNGAFWANVRRNRGTEVLVGCAFLLWCGIVIAGRWIAYLQAG